MASNFDKYKTRGIEKRYAFEWFMRDADEFYWGMTKERIGAETEKQNRRINKTTALAVTSTVVASVAIAISVLVLLRK